jgi:chromosome partitioning protein
MIITFASFKGGVGKTTSSIHLACYLAKKGETILIDGDRNKSATHWGKRGKLPFQVIDLYQASMQNKKVDHMVIDTQARPAREDLESLVEGCDLLILPSSPDALAMDALLQTVDVLKDMKCDRYKILLTMVHSKPVKMAEQARDALEGTPIFKTEIRRFIAYEKAALLGSPVFEVKGDRMAKVAWTDYEALGKEILR